MRDNKVLESFIRHTEKKLKEMNLFKFLKKKLRRVLTAHKITSLKKVLTKVRKRKHEVD